MGVGRRGGACVQIETGTGNMYGGTSLIRNCHLLRLYIRRVPRTLRWSLGGGSFL